jgi:GNAT superfamily N-acetyltransferase
VHGTVGIEILPVGADDGGAIDEWFALSSLIRQHLLPDTPPPSPVRSRARLRWPWPGVREHVWLARVDGRAAGLAEASLGYLDNLDNAHVEVQVHPDLRRDGLGRRLLEHLVDHCRADGRARVIGSSMAALPGGSPRDPAGSAFAVAMGAAAAHHEVRSRLDLTTLDDARLLDLRVDGWRRAGGYSIVQWSDHVPDPYVADIARLDSRLLQDAPMGDLKIEPEKIDVVRTRATEDVRLARGERSYHTGLRHDATDALVAWTLVVVDAMIDYHGWQQITIVDPVHRGNRLGIIAKVENLAYARRSEPLLRQIDTWNAAGNTHMIAINEQLGFRPVDRWVGWQLEL